MQSSSFTESLERLQDFPRESAEVELGGMGLFLQLLRYHSDSHDQMSHGGGVPLWFPSPPLWHSLCWFGQSPTPTLPSSHGSTHLKIPLCASELVACELGDGVFPTPHPKGCKAALKSHQKSVLPTSPAGRREEGSPLHLPGWKDGLSPSAWWEDRGLKLLPNAGVTDRCCQSVLNSG